MSKRVHRRKHPAAELNITAFMNLMVVLVPFLLMTAVFSHITILDLNLPPPGAQDTKQPKKPPYELRITIRQNMLVLSDNRLGLIKRIPSKGKEHNFAQLKETLKQVKSRLPNHTNITILAEQRTRYDDLIRAMDSSRSYRAQVDGEWVFAELFPDISIGDAAK
ncbi:MAG: biopolymer transporter ExbD [Gammaproteobacteria bacterium]|nr:biopolymer transporter ExbD [Gammaproteobacteria bacterium]MCP4983681.1 biopolymer transporter ExbD [Gammaproteobacteria bacterium]